MPSISSMMKSEYIPGQNCSLSIDGSEHNSVSSISSPQRRGKWSDEEEAYAQAAIRDFNSGHLNAPLGITLRTYLSDKLQCDPMRITKKFTGDCLIYLLNISISCTSSMHLTCTCNCILLLCLRAGDASIGKKVYLFVLLCTFNQLQSIMWSIFLSLAYFTFY